MILVFTTGESIGPTGERSPVVTLLKNALVEESGGPFGCSRTTRFLVLILGVIVAVSCDYHVLMCLTHNLRRGLCSHQSSCGKMALLLLTVIVLCISATNSLLRYVYVATLIDK